MALNYRAAILLIAVAFPAVVVADPSVIKARVEETVLQELMGGCSLKCAFGWGVEVQPAPGQKAVPLKVLNDDNAETAWTAPEGASGVGAKFRFTFPKQGAH